MQNEQFKNRRDPEREVAAKTYRCLPNLEETISVANASNARVLHPVVIGVIEALVS